MKKRKRIIKDKKLRGEWAESVFMERATQHGLAVSKPWGEMCSYDFVVGKPGRFVSVQVKSTIMQEQGGYVCTVRSGHRRYPTGSFDFLAAYLVIEDIWYIVPAPEVQGKKVVTLYPKSTTAKYEKYREAWYLLREAAEVAEPEIVEEPAKVQENSAEAAPRFPRNAMERMEYAFNFCRRQMERGGVVPAKDGEDG